MLFNNYLLVNQTNLNQDQQEGTIRRNYAYGVVDMTARFSFYRNTKILNKSASRLIKMISINSV